MIDNLKAVYGQRLLEAREARGLTKTELADSVGLSPTSLTLYEKGERYPLAEHQVAICEALRLPANFFRWSVPPAPESPVFFRAKKRAAKRMKKRAKRRLEWFRQLVLFSEAYVDLPPLKLPDIDVPEDPNEIEDDMIEEAALKCRKHWGMGLGPISNALWHLENIGIPVCKMNFDANVKSFDGFCWWPKGDSRPYIALNNVNDFCVRTRMNVMHELGHIILHRKVPVVNDDDYDLLEKQAFRFAGALMMPEDSFGNEVLSWQPEILKQLKPRWKMSISAMLRRGLDLKRINQSQYDYQARKIGLKKWRTIEPYDDVLETENPRLGRTVYETLLDNEIVTKTDISLNVPLGKHDIESLLSLSKGFMSDVYDSGSQMRPLRIIARNKD